MRLATAYLGDCARRHPAHAAAPTAMSTALSAVVAADGPPHPRPRRPRLHLAPARSRRQRADAAAGDRAGRGAAADLHPADRQRRHLRADRPLLRRLRRAALRALRPLALPPRPAADGAARPPARPGPDLRRRRQPGQPAGGLGGARTGARSSASPGARASSSPARAPARCAGSRPASPSPRASPAAEAGLGLLGGSLCVHYNNEPERRAAYLEAVGNGMPDGYGLDDYAGLIWEGPGPPSAVTARRGARAYRVTSSDTGVVESPLPGTLPTRARPSGLARGHRRVPPDQKHAQAGRLAGLASVLAPGVCGIHCPACRNFGVIWHEPTEIRPRRRRDTGDSRRLWRRTKKQPVTPPVANPARAKSLASRYEPESDARKARRVLAGCGADHRFVALGRHSYLPRRRTGRSMQAGPHPRTPLGVRLGALLPRLPRRQQRSRSRARRSCRSAEKRRPGHRRSHVLLRDGPQSRPARHPPVLVLLPVQLPGSSLAPSASSLNTDLHEGDIEGMSILLSAHKRQPVYVWMPRHRDEGERFTWNEGALQRRRQSPDRLRR